MGYSLLIPALMCSCVNSFATVQQHTQTQPRLMWPRWLENHLADWKVASLIPSQGTCLGCEYGPWSRCVWEAPDQCFLSHIDVSLPLSPSSPLSLRSISMSLGEDKKNPDSVSLHKQLLGRSKVMNPRPSYYIRDWLETFWGPYGGVLDDTVLFSYQKS